MGDRVELAVFMHRNTDSSVWNGSKNLRTDRNHYTVPDVTAQVLAVGLHRLSVLERVAGHSAGPCGHGAAVAVAAPGCPRGESTARLPVEQTRRRRNQTTSQ